MPEGALAVFYTDGLVERRDQVLGRRLELLRRTVTAMPAEAACGRIMAEFVGDQVIADDIALLAVHHQGVRGRA
ncbi:SpoIIE family protein phosphatase [Saccharothrix sp. NPDC042600]|uniref:SpoIIE family protein phosphatase n=1 Tax=Saccharothrix TaxID=2071 RepID=UPI0033C57A10